MNRLFFILGAGLGASGVALGAMAAHALEATLEAAGTQGVWETAARYQMFHALALLVVAGFAVGPAGARWLRRAGWLLVAGTICFSGSLYVLCLHPTRAIALVTPLGGLLLIAGWLALIPAATAGAGRSRPPAGADREA